MAARTPENRIPKCVKAPSEGIPADEFDEIAGLVESYSDCMDLFYARFSGMNSMCLVQKRNKLRDMVRAEQKQLLEGRENGSGTRKTLVEQFGFQDRYWVMALFDVCANVDSAWSNLASRVKERVRDNESLSDAEKSYCYYILKARPLWQVVLQKRDFPEKLPAKFKSLRGAVDAGRFGPVHSLIRRLTRKNKAEIPRTKRRRTMTLDQEMYRITEHGGSCYVEFASRVRGKRFKAKLRCTYTWKRHGTIRLVVDRAKRTVTIHKLIYAKKRRPVPGGTELGTDKGYATFLSCSDGRLEYIMEMYRCESVDVNPAYTSQFCPSCGAPIERKGKHHEVSVCPNCGEGNANTGAAKNILARLHDPEITLYTPYKKVREILLARYGEKDAAQAAPAAN